MKTSTVLAALATALCGCSGGSGGNDASATNTDATPAGACNFPSCMQALGAACIPSGTCTSEVGTGTMVVCYANGLRYASTLGGSGATIALTVTNGSTTCFTGTGAAPTGSSSALTYTIQNPAGATIATLSQDMSTGAASITCAGGQPVQLNDACSGGGGCAVGTCP